MSGFFVLVILSFCKHCSILLNTRNDKYNCREYNVFVRFEDEMVYMIQKLTLKNFFYLHNQTTGVAEE
jgi:hypothetical protein